MRESADDNEQRKRERTGRGGSVRQPVREIEGDRERRGELSSWSLTHSYCSGYRTELRGR